MTVVLDPDLHSVCRSNGAHLRDVLWDYCFKNILGGKSYGVRVRHRGEANCIRFWVDFYSRPSHGPDMVATEFEITIDYGEHPQVLFDRCAAMCMLLEGKNVVA